MSAIRKEILDHKLIYLVLAVVLASGLFFRVYRVNDLLGFYYDQGRDALRIASIFAEKDFPAIGPTTGIEGIFLGPFWYYLLVFITDKLNADTGLTWAVPSYEILKNRLPFFVGNYGRIYDHYLIAYYPAFIIIVDVYVPPIIPYAYTYLIPWRGKSRYQQVPVAEKRPLLYTLYEVEQVSFGYLDSWLARQSGIGKVMAEAKFGGITVQRRERLR